VAKIETVELDEGVYEKKEVRVAVLIEDIE